MVLGLGYFLQGFGAQLLRDLAPTIRAEAHRALGSQSIGSAAAYPARLRRGCTRLRLERGSGSLPGRSESHARVGRHAVGLRYHVSERVWPLR